MSVITRDTIGNCAVLTLNRPDSLNAITTEMIDLLEQQLDEIEKDDSRALILTGTGRSFCSGTDLKVMPTDLKARIEHVHRLVLRLQTFPKLSVAAINGLAMGGGLELALSCSFRVAVRQAQLGLPEIKIGVMPAYGGTALLPGLIGTGRAQAMMLSGEPVSAEEGLAMGLVNRICDNAEEVVQLANDFLQPMYSKSLVSQQAIRRAILEADGLSLEDALAHEAQLVLAVSQSEDSKEGIRSFIEKRKPNWMDR